MRDEDNYEWRENAEEHVHDYAPRAGAFSHGPYQTWGWFRYEYHSYPYYNGIWHLVIGKREGFDVYEWSIWEPNAQNWWWSSTTAFPLGTTLEQAKEATRTILRIAKVRSENEEDTATTAV